MKGEIIMNKSMLLFALNVIKDECIKNEKCDNCPFYIPEGGCGIRHSIPSEWSILDDEPCEEQLIF